MAAVEGSVTRWFQLHRLTCYQYNTLNKDCEQQVTKESNHIEKPGKTSTCVQACCAGNGHVNFLWELHEPNGLQHQSKTVTPWTHLGTRNSCESKQGHHLVRGKSITLHSNTIHNLVVSLKNSYNIAAKNTGRIKAQSNYKGFLLHKLNHSEMLQGAHNGHKNEQRYSKNYGCY